MTQDIQNKRILNIGDVAEIMGVTQTEVTDLIKAGDLPAVGTNKNLIRSVDLYKFLGETPANSFDKPIDESANPALPSYLLRIEDIEKEDFNMVKKEYGTGSVYWNEKRNCWQAAFYMVENDIKKRKILSAPTRDEAYLRMAQLRSGGVAFIKEDDIPQKREYHKIKDIWDYILNVKKAKIKPETKEWYETIIKPVLIKFGDTNIEDLTSQDIQEFINSLMINLNGTSASESKVKKTTEQLKAIIKYSIEEGYITRNPFNSNVERHKGVERDPRLTAFSVEELEILLKALKHHESIVLRTIVPALLLSGLRIEELIYLRYSDLNRKDNTIYVSKSKTEAGLRTIPVPPLFFKIVDNWHDFVYKNPKRVLNIHKFGTEDIIFVGMRGSIRNEDTTRADCAALLKKLGLKKTNTTFHGFRRTYATLLHECKADDKTIAQLLGHKIRNDDGCDVVRDHYIRIYDEEKQTDMKEAIDKFVTAYGKLFEDNIHFTHYKKTVIR